MKLKLTMADNTKPPTDNKKKASKHKSPASGKVETVTSNKEKKIENNNKATSDMKEKVSNNNRVAINKKEVGHSEVDNKEAENRDSNNRAVDNNNKKKKVDGKNKASINKKEDSQSEVDDNNRPAIDKKEVGHNDVGSSNKEEVDISKNGSNKKEVSLSGVEINKEKKLINNNMPRRGQAGNLNGGRGYSRGGGYRRGRAYFGNHRGIRGWSRGWGHAGYNNSFHHKKMINTGPSSAYQGHDQSFYKPHDSSPPVHYKTFSHAANASSQFHPELPPTFIINVPAQDCFNPQVIQEDCQYFPQFWEPGQQLGQMPDYQGGFYLPHHFQSYNYAGGAAQGAQDDLSSAMAGLELEKSKRENDKNESISDKPTTSADESKTTKEQQTGDEADENSRMLYQNKKDQQIIASFVTNPLCSLGISVEHDKQLVESFCGVEMRPSSPFPPDFTVQQFYVPYGAPLPHYVIPVMVIPIRNQFYDVENKAFSKDDGYVSYK